MDLAEIPRELVRIDMLERFRRKVYFEDTLKTYYPNVVEAFVQYYGESMRDTIVDKLDSVALAGFYPLEKMQENYFSLRNNKAKQLMDEFWDEIKVFFLNESSIAKRQLFDWSFMNFLNYSNRIHPFERLISDLKDCSKISVHIKMIYHINDNEYKKRKNNGEFDFFEKDILPVFNKYKNKYLKFCEIFEWVNGYASKNIQSHQENKSECEFEYIKEFLLNDCKFLITSEDEEKIMLAKNLQDLKNLGLSSIVIKILGIDFENDTLIDLFHDSFDNNRIILQKRIELLKILGFNFGTNYLDYEKDSKCFNLIQKLKLLARIKTLIKWQCEDEICSLQAETQTIISQLKEHNLKFTDYEQYAIGCVGSKDKTAGSITFDVSKTTNKICPIFCLNLGSLLTIDETLIHELNHVLEMNIIFQNQDDEYVYACGWQQGVRSSEKKELDQKYLMINEVINEFISQDIVKIMRENNTCVFEPKSEKFEYVSVYNIGFIILKDFFETYKEQIIQSRLNNDLNILYEVVGKNNFEELNELLISFCNTFNLADLDLEGHIVVDNHYKKLEYESFVSKRNTLLKKMHEYNSSRSR